MFRFDLHIYFQWTEDRQGFQIQYLTLDTWPRMVPRALSWGAPRNFRVKYQESSIGFENLAHLQSTENKCKRKVLFVIRHSENKYVHYMFTIYSLYVHYIFAICSLYIHYMFTIYSLYVHYIFTICSLYIHYMFTIFSLHAHHMFTIYSLHVHYVFTICSLYIHYIFTMCLLHVHYMFIICSL